MTVIELLDELEDVIDTASAVPLTGKVVVEKNEILELVNDIKKSLPDDVKQAKWLKDEQDRILTEAKQEYEKLLAEAKKQADYMIDNDDITIKAKKYAEQISASADEYCRSMKLRTYDYIDKLLFDMQNRMNELDGKFFEIFNDYCRQQFDGFNEQCQDEFRKFDEKLAANREELKKIASRAEIDADWDGLSNNDDPNAGPEDENA